jgi:hypothetical protein
MTSTTKTVTTAKGFKFDVYPDASGFTGLLNVGGDLFAVNYTDRVNVVLVNAKSGSKPARWKAGWARSIASDFAATLPAEWHNANREMYAA